MSKRTEIQAGLEEYAEELADARMYDGSGCHCCCCTGECTGAFEESTPEQQAEWMANYWEAVRRGEA